MIASAHIAARRVSSLVLAVTLLAANAATLVHELTARHAVCAEHGEIIESNPGGEQAVRHADGSNLPVLDAEAGSEAAHEHCAVLAELRSRLTPPSSQQSVMAPWPQATAAMATSQVRAESRWLYRLAPKSGPPSKA